MPRRRHTGERRQWRSRRRARDGDQGEEAHATTVVDERAAIPDAGNDVAGAGSRVGGVGTMDRGHSQMAAGSDPGKAARVAAGAIANGIPLETEGPGNGAAFKERAETPGTATGEASGDTKYT